MEFNDRAKLDGTNQPALPGTERERAPSTAKQVAALMGISDRQLRNWVREGLAHPYRVGRRVYYSADEVDRLVGNLAPKSGTDTAHPEKSDG